MENIKDGVWATMITPFSEEGKIDYGGVDILVEWYINNGVDGIFAVCQSSEMFWLSAKERYDLAKHVIKAAGDRTEVIVSGNVEQDIRLQIKEARLLAELGPKAVVFVSNRLEDEGVETEFLKSVDEIIKEMPEQMPIGIYECPHPKKRLLSEAECAYLAKSGRFAFLKDTSCDAAMMERRAAAVAGSPFKLYNANAATLYQSLKSGYSGYCGVMANYHPELYVWLCKNLRDERAKRLEKYLGLMSVMECRAYPQSAKRYLKLFENLDINHFCRSQKAPPASSVDLELGAFYEVSRELEEFVK
ncbi:MAG: dihydrodipicolinate synthase family protein [Oscillospiraceae bacterium]|nr:dihydrodipicolinate synthase family protein [Oscillospiraceae bacterium]